MAYNGQDFEVEGSGFEYPPLPDSYANPYSTLDATSIYNGHYPPIPEHLAKEPTSYPYYVHQAKNPSIKAPVPYFHQNHGFKGPALRQNASIPSPVTYSGHAPSPSPAPTEHIMPPTDFKNTKFISYKKRSRGTTGNIVCDECGYRFTVASSLYRHEKVCHSKKRAKSSISPPPKSIKKKKASLSSDYNINASPATKTVLPPPEEQYPDLGDPGHKPNLHTTSAASTEVGPLGARNASLISDPLTHNPSFQEPTSTQFYAPPGVYTDAHYEKFFCNLCPAAFARRDLLQMHEFQVHGFTEFPYLPDSGAIERPPYLDGVTFEKANKHQLQALKIFEGGGLSSSPCQHCASRGLDCIVNPFVSSRCFYCNYRDNGKYCGAAGVKYL